MTDAFEIRPRAEVPENARGRTGLTNAIRKIQPAEAIFIPLNGRTPQAIQTKALACAAQIGLQGRIASRVDREKNGVWVFLKEQSE